MTGWRIWMPDLLHILERIATALERIADQGDNHLNQEPRKR
jgi:hypothetical protein